MRAVKFVCILLLVCSYFVSARNVKFTYYWISSEDDFPQGSDKMLKNCNGGTIATISKEFWNSLHTECSGRLSTGEYVNGGDSYCNCFIKVPGPIGPKGNRLRPYTSIAANDIPYGSKVFIQQLQNLTLPNGKIHNGCLRVDDVGWSFGDNRIDFYVLQKSNYEQLSSQINNHVDIIVNSNCVIQRY